MKRQPARGQTAPPRRVVVVSPQTQLALARRGRGARKVVQRHDVDIAAARAAYTRQRRLALISMAALATVVIGLPVLLAFLPGLGRLRLGDIPVSWLMMGALPFPALLAVAWAHLRAAERAEWPDGGRR
jgi:hypothetical protein